jgi:hypothetical protein
MKSYRHIWFARPRKHKLRKSEKYFLFAMKKAEFSSKDDVSHKKQNPRAIFSCTHRHFHFFDEIRLFFKGAGFLTFLQLTRGHPNQFKFLNSTISLISNKHVAKKIETKSIWIKQLVGLETLSRTSN